MNQSPCPGPDSSPSCLHLNHKLPKQHQFHFFFTHEAFRLNQWLIQNFPDGGRQPYGDGAYYIFEMRYEIILTS